MKEGLESALSHKFSTPQTLWEALTHRSYSVEHDLPYDNQRLEFLGDAVLEIILTEYLYKKYPGVAEGQLTKMRAALVQQESLAVLARDISVGDHLRMGKGEMEAGGNRRESTLSDAFEAVLGALYLDAGLEKTRGFVLPLVELHFPDPERLLLETNPKGALQEFTQKKFNAGPSYAIVEVSGPDHEPLYKVNVSVKGEVVGSGAAQNRKAAESLAAKNALERYERLYGRQ